MECPYCKKEMQVRAIFNHIRKLHSDEFLKATSRRWIEEASTGQPLKLFWTKLNDFDEEEYTVLYADLSTNKTFTVESKALEHFKKDKAALKEHNKQLKDMKKAFEAMRKQEAKKQKEQAKNPTDPYKLKLHQAFATNDIDLVKSLWRGIFHHKKNMELSLYVCDKLNYCNETPMYLHKKFNDYEEVSFKEFLDIHHKLIEEVESKYCQRCNDATYLKTLWSKCYTMWACSYTESVSGLFYELRKIHPLFDERGEEKYFNFATEEMEDIDF